MPRELVALGPRQLTIRAYAPPPLGPGMVRIVSEFGSPKHGTELLLVRAAPAITFGRYDEDWRCLIPGSPMIRFPCPLGNMIVGRVTDVGDGVTVASPGDRVYGYSPLREVIVAAPERMRLRPMPPGLSDDAAVCLDPAEVALAMRDAHVRIGDRVAVFGLGAIGLFAIQYCRLSGAALVIAVDPLEIRRKLALQLGADVALDPTPGDVGLEIKQRTDKLGVDVALEVSGNPRALHQAIRATRYQGTVGIIAAYPAGAADLYLGQEFHWNAIHLVSCRTVSAPLRDYGWDHARLVNLAEDMLISGQLRPDRIIQPIVSFEEAAEAYQQIDQHPEACVKLGVRFEV